MLLTLICFQLIANALLIPLHTVPKNPFSDSNEEMKEEEEFVPYRSFSKQYERDYISPLNEYGKMSFYNPHPEDYDEDEMMKQPPPFTTTITQLQRKRHEIPIFYSNYENALKDVKKPKRIQILNCDQYYCVAYDSEGIPEVLYRKSDQYHLPISYPISNMDSMMLKKRLEKRAIRNNQMNYWNADSSWKSEEEDTVGKKEEKEKEEEKWIPSFHVPDDEFLSNHEILSPIRRPNLYNQCKSIKLLTDGCKQISMLPGLALDAEAHEVCVAHQACYHCAYPDKKSMKKCDQLYLLEAERMCQQNEEPYETCLETAIQFLSLLHGSHSQAPDWYSKMSTFQEAENVLKNACSDECTKELIFYRNQKFDELKNRQKNNREKFPS